jgi:uncharacterized protein YfaS (alpha-2-macroglobulin family)
VRGLLGLRKGASYANTQEDAWALLALDAYRAAAQTAAQNVNVELFWAGQSQGKATFDSPSPRVESFSVPASKLASGTTSDLFIELSDKGSVSYAVELRLAKASAAANPLDEGLSVQKLFRGVDAGDVAEVAKSIASKSASQAKLGQLVLVDLLLETAEPREQVVLVDPLPAGLEPIEFRFAATTQALAMSEGAANLRRSTSSSVVPGYAGIQEMLGVRREMHDDQVLYFISHLGAGIYHFRYLARATSTGAYVVPPTRAECMYDSEVFGQNRAAVFEITEQRQ